MVGGRSFSVRGRMCCGVASGGLMVRVGRAQVASALDEPYVSPMSMGGRPLAAFVIIAPQGVATDALLAAWVQRGLTAVTREAGSAAAGRAGRGSQPQVKASRAAAAHASATERFAELVQHFAHHPGVALPEHGRDRGFGSSALKVDGSIFAMLTQGRLVVKLPQARVTELVDAGTGVPFTAGKTAPMKEWLSITDDEPSTRLALAQEALAFVRDP